MEIGTYAIYDKDTQLIGFGEGRFNVKGDDLNLTIDVLAKELDVQTERQTLLNPKFKEGEIVELNSGDYKIKVEGKTELDHIVTGANANIKYKQKGNSSSINISSGSVVIINGSVVSGNMQQSIGSNMEPQNLEVYGNNADIKFKSGASSLSVYGDNCKAKTDVGSGQFYGTGESMKVKIDAGSGKTTVEGDNANVDVDAGSGDVTVKGKYATVKVDAGSAKVFVEGERAEINTDLGSGQVHYTGNNGILDLDFGSGKLYLNGDNNDVTVDGSRSPKHHVVDNGKNNNIHD